MTAGGPGRAGPGMGMDRDRFDAWSKRLAPWAGSRRTVLRLLAVGVIGAVLGAGERDAAGRKTRAARRRRQVEQQVVGGRDVPDGRYPFAAALLDRTFGDTPFAQQFCGGSLITPSHVLTAAHCVTDPRPRLQDLGVLVGRTRLNGTDGESREVSKISVHPRYGSSAGQYDVAVLTLDQPVASAPIAPMAVGDGALDQAGIVLTTIGWGDTNPNAPSGSGADTFPDRLQEAELPVRPDQVCRDVYGSGSYTGALMICAGGEEGVSGCFGDSGGPLFGTVDGEYRLAGVVNYGAGCDGDIPGAFAQVNAAGIAAFVAAATGACEDDPGGCPPPSPTRKKRRKKRKHKGKGKHGR